MKKRIIAAIAMLSMFTGTAAAVSTYQKNITVEYGVGLNFEGQAMNLTDVSGKTVQPFVYDGTTYVPLRAVSEAFGGSVRFDAQTNSVTLTDDLGYAYHLMYMIGTTTHRIFIDATSLRDDVAWNTLHRSTATSSYDSTAKQVESIHNYINATLSLGNEYVAYIDENCIPLFDDLYSSYGKMVTQYQNLCDTKQNMYGSGVFTYFDEIIDAYFNCTDALDGWYND